MKTLAHSLRRQKEVPAFEETASFKVSASHLVGAPLGDIAEYKDPCGRRQGFGADDPAIRQGLALLARVNVNVASYRHTVRSEILGALARRAARTRLGAALKAGRMTLTNGVRIAVVEAGALSGQKPARWQATESHPCASWLRSGKLPGDLTASGSSAQTRRMTTKTSPIAVFHRIARWFCVVAFTAAVATFLHSGLAADAPKIKVLLITGDDVMPAHDWPTVSVATREILSEEKKFDVKVCEDAGILDSAASIGRYDVIYFAMYNAKTPTLSDQAKQNLLSYVKGGKGFVVSHLASASFAEWPEFKPLCGRIWVMRTSGHGPRSKFQVKVTDTSSPITKGLSDFEADDELYAKLQGDAQIQVLLTADSDWSRKTEPLAFTLDYGQGRVFHHTFGHDVKALQNRSVRTVIVRGTEWAATGKVVE